MEQEEFAPMSLIERLVEQMQGIQRNGQKAVRVAQCLQARLDCAEAVVTSALGFVRLLSPSEQARLAAEVDALILPIADRFAEKPDEPVDALVSATVNRYRAALRPPTRDEGRTDGS